MMPLGGGDASQRCSSYRPVFSLGGLVSVALLGLSKPSGFLSDMLLFQIPAASWSYLLIQHLKLLLSPWWEFEALCSSLPSVRFSLSSEKVDKRIFKHLNVIFLLKIIKAAINSMYCLVIEMKGSNFSYVSCTCSFFHWTLHLLRANSPTEHS